MADMRRGCFCAAAAVVVVIVTTVHAMNSDPATGMTRRLTALAVHRWLAFADMIDRSRVDVVHFRPGMIDRPMKDHHADRRQEATTMTMDQSVSPVRLFDRQKGHRNQLGRLGMVGLLFGRQNLADRCLESTKARLFDLRGTFDCLDQLRDQNESLDPMLDCRGRIDRQMGRRSHFGRFLEFDPWMARNELVLLTGC